MAVDNGANLEAMLEKFGETANRIADQRNDLLRELGRIASVLENIVPRLKNVHALLARELEMDLSRIRAAIARAKQPW